MDEQLEKFFTNCSAVDAAIVATLDGKLRAQKQRHHYPVERLAVMGSSLMSLGDTITEELAFGPCNNIISENRDGLVVFMHICGDLVLICLTQSKSELGLLLSWARLCVSDIAKVA